MAFASHPVEMFLQSFGPTIGPLMYAFLVGNGIPKHLYFLWLHIIQAQGELFVCLFVLIEN